MSENKVSVICTVYNEGKSMKELLDSLVNQTKTPDEAIFVDAGSDDGTREVIEEYAENHDWIHLLVEEGCNIAEGRNIAIENASYENILTTDGGCVLDEEWVEKLAEKLEVHDAVTGNFKPVKETAFDRALGALLVDHVERQAEEGNLTPSSRSMGIKKKLWEQVGGYPEELYTGEDTEFCRQILEKGHDFVFAKEATLTWEMRDSYREVINQFYTYGEGDARAGNLFTYTSSIFGISKSFLQVGVNIAFFAFLLLSFVQIFFLPIALLTFAMPYGYYLKDILSLWKDPKATFHALILVPVKNWAYTIGFLKEVLQNFFVDR